MAPLSGRRFMLGFTLVIAFVATAGFFTLRQAKDRRFAISIRTIPESQIPDVVVLGRSVVVRIEKRTAGRSPLLAQAMLVDGDAGVLSDLHPLRLRTLPNGKPVEEVVFPPLQVRPAQHLVGAIVVRIPTAQLEAVRAQLPEILQRTRAEKSAPGDTLRVAFGRVLPFCRGLGGHAELVQAEVREKP